MSLTDQQVTTTVTTSRPRQTTHQNRSTTMNTMHEDLARAHMSARLGEAQELRAGHHLARARRLSRRAERAAQQARLALARAL
ncbi:hypothetical protein [Nocardioides sp.]|jgi:hypothetical protein|uniref:hypothetical protein n=1 Tax=Nocardioides sp. TaxID=35761 RepID=UPI0026334CE9|nr:hypothetical protein [Nocardioides sp.]